MVIGLFKIKNAHAVNMEPSATNPGIPDINWCMSGIEGNLELKFKKDDLAMPLIRPAQIVWFRERIRAGGYPMVAYYVESKEYTDEVYIVQGRYLEDLVDADDITDVPYLRMLEPQELIEAMISEIASWHDELNPQIMTLN